MQICVIGVGYVGLVTSSCLAEAGNHVICVDNNREKKLIRSFEASVKSLAQVFQHKRAFNFSHELELVMYLLMKTRDADKESVDKKGIPIYLARIEWPCIPNRSIDMVIWKPGRTTILTGYYIYKLLEEAGMPPGVINFVPGESGDITDVVLHHRDFAGVHFTGSTSTFQSMWATIGTNIKNYRSYPRIVGETGGKDFIFVHESADVEEVAVATIRGAFEYQGQKCSAASRLYVPESMWPELKLRIGEMLDQIKMGDVMDFGNFMNAMIDEPSFDTTMDYIEKAKSSADAEILFGGKGDKSGGYFVEPTVIQALDPHFLTMEEEIFAPVLTVYAYENKKFEETLTLCDETSPYALTGAVFARDRGVIARVSDRLRHSAGNFYINDKPTGAVVGQQPFGGARGSGTNDKAGSYLNLIRWVSPRTIKENFIPPVDFSYPFMK